MTTSVPGISRPHLHHVQHGVHREGHFRWMYLWGLPLRLTHWFAAVTMLVLIITGFYIGRPYFMASASADVRTPFAMGWMRAIHFTAAAVFVGAGILRVYWLFTGNRYEHWRALFPVFPKDWVHMWQQVRFYLMVRPEEAPRYLGHNPLQQLSYTAIYGLAVVMIGTGFTLYAQAEPTRWMFTLTTWIPHLLGGLQNVRFIHHASTWIFLMFIPIHVYLASRADIVEHGGTISSMVSGGRFVEAGYRYADEDEGSGA